MNVPNENYPSQPSNSHIWAYLILITIGGCLARFYQLGSESLWFDEMQGLNQSTASSVREVIDGMRRDVHPPGWSVLLHFVQKVVGNSPFAIRLPSALAGALSIPAIFFLGRYVFSNVAGLIAATILAFTWTQIDYSQEARAYAVLILLSILTSYVLLRFLDSLRSGNSKWPLFIGYVLLAALMCYLHYSGLIIIFMQGCWAFVTNLRRSKTLFYVVCLFSFVVLLYMPWLLEVMTDLNRESYWVKTVASPLNVLDFFFFKSALKLHIPVLIILLGVLFWEAIKSKGRFLAWLQSPVSFIVLWLVFPYLAFYLKSLVGTPILHARYILVSTPAAYLLLGHAASLVIANNRIRLFLMVVGITALCGWMLLAKLDYYGSPRVPQFKEIVRFIIDYEEVPLSKAFITSAGGRTSRVYNYYLSQFNANARIDKTMKFRKNQSALSTTSQEQLAELRTLLRSQEKQYVWLLTRKSESHENVLQMLNEEGELLLHVDKYKNTGAFLFRLKPTAGVP